MPLRKLTAALAFTAIICAGAFGASVAFAAPNAPRSTMPAFRSDAELIAYLKRIKRVQERRQKSAQPVPAPPPSPPAMSAPAAADSAASESTAAQGITNTQEAGVDEGGIVKMRGDILVILRRGRLFTVSTAGGDLRPIDSINAFPPGVDPRSDWYDEMLIAGDRVIVIGYSYGRGGTEINRFRLDREGRLRFEDAYHLKSNDYYSSRNYASRLIGTRLIVYSPLYLPYNVADSFEWMPGVRRWSGDPKAGFERIVSARQIYLPRPWENPEEADADALHTVTNCDLAAPVLYCNATAVLGPSGRNFYVSANAVYVWVSQGWWGRKVDGRRPQSMLYRLPLDGSAPSAIGVRGTPTDQFSFSEDWRAGVINVLVRGSGGGDAMWSPEFATGRVALLRLPLGQFGGGGDEAARSYYRHLPSPAGSGYAFQNRFVGDYVLYGMGAGWGSQRGGSVLVAASVRGYGVTEIPLPHGVDRIEAMGRDAVVVGGDGRDLHFRALELTSGWRPQLGDVYRLEGAAQGETRSHAFFFKPEPRDDETAGVLALPVVRGNRPGYRQLAEGSAAVLFLRRSERKFNPLGELEANGESVRNDGCQASCVDWYGNARPIFLPRRTFALMGYELVEGELGPTSIRETRRVNFAPGRW